LVHNPDCFHQDRRTGACVRCIPRGGWCCLDPRTLQAFVVGSSFRGFGRTALSSTMVHLSDSSSGRGRKLLSATHCNPGHQRIPSLALYRLVTREGILPETSLVEPARHLSR